MFIDGEGTQGRVIMTRILPGSDLVKSIEAVCHKRGINCGIISMCIGSLKEAAFIYALPFEGNYFNMVYSDPVHRSGIFEFLNGQGIVARDENGKFQIHLHGTISDSHMKLYGCHILNEGNIVLATIEVVITEIKDMQLVREYHKESGFYFFKPQELEEK